MILASANIEIVDDDQAYENSNIDANVRGEGLMQRVITMLLLEGKIKKWYSTRFLHGDLSLSAQSMFQRMKADSRLKVEGPIDLYPGRGIKNKTGFTVAALPILDEKVGGIDLNPALLNIETEGTSIEFDLPFDIHALEDLPITGFAPSIFNITPIINLPLFLGLEDKQESSNDIDLSLNALDPVDSKKRFEFLEGAKAS